MNVETVLRFLAACWALQLVLSGWSINFDRTETGYRGSLDYSYGNLIGGAFLTAFAVLGFGLFGK
ncbi:hypothetical protein CcrC1_gp391 [Caulobacter phage C1]|nr:hypothetical protein CcrC1_gp391 [Caulobacter phage C1]UTU08620.1 hypothetical protein CcrC2_gp392 [Caulobacter phage C2]UTU09135.1 hypothetical protein CcrJ4_gp386 [Caulobacter phage J4]UTU10253.1 hypothetical protein CcrRB23_gp391 [Caulobacter phage RB23]WGN97287.1 hypothetical protein [Bertelyvirus sp.]